VQSGRNRWLQSVVMRIELPPVTWADAAHRPEDDAHTLTMASQPTTEWALLLGEAETLPLRTEVSTVRLPIVTLTF
jgi:hypothetical protein